MLIIVRMFRNGLAMNRMCSGGRALSGQTSRQSGPDEDEKKELVGVTKKEIKRDSDGESRTLPPQRFEPAMIPKDARDNFLIGFNHRIPTYDQIFEYQTNEKLYNKMRFINESFFLSVDMKARLTQKYDLSRPSVLRWFRNLAVNQQLKEQQYLPRRHGILGPEIGASHFILSRGGRVRFKHMANRWITELDELPQQFEKHYRLISIDGSDCGLVYDGLDNLILLHQLEELNLARNRKLDDWACDKLARLFRNSKRLRYLDLSGLPHLTHRGVEALHKIQSLRTVVIRDTQAARYPFIRLLVILFQEVNPDCEIIYC